MKRRKLCILIAGSLILLINAGAVSASQRIFPDVQTGHWAEKDIAEMKAKGNIAGYSDGLYHPNEKLSREQAVAMVLRAAGFKGSKPQNSLRDLGLSKGVSWHEDVSPWAKESLAVAWEKGIIPEAYLSDFRPQDPIKRHEMAVLAVRATGLGEEVQERDGSGLAFSDVWNIPAASRGYVEVALEKGIFTGYSDNTFRPEEELTRLHVAAILERVDELQNNSYDNAAVGKVVSAPDSSDIVTIMNESGEESQFTLSPQAFIYDGRNTAVEQLPSAALMQGLKVELVTGGDGLVTYGEILDETSGSGTGGSWNNGSGTTGTGGVQEDGEVLDYLAGEIQDLNGKTDTITITTYQNQMVVLVVSRKTMIVKSGKEIDFNDLEEGEEILAAGDLDGSVMDVSGIIVLSK